MRLAWKSFKRHYLWKSLFSICFLLLAASFLTDNFSSLSDLTGFVSKSGGYGGEKVKVDFYVMSQCSFGTQVEDAIAPILEELGDAVSFNLNFIGKVVGPNRFQSLHGQSEIDENIRQLCVQKYNRDKLMDYLLCQNKDIRNAESNWEMCAGSTGIDAATIKRCFKGEDGKKLLADSFVASKQVGASGSPTIFINDKPYNGGRDSLSFKRIICQDLENHQPCTDLAECFSNDDCNTRGRMIGICEDSKCTYKEPVKVELTVLNDDECGSCDIGTIVSAARGFFPGLEMKLVDVKSEEGKALVEKYGIELVPAYLFGGKVPQSLVWQTKPRIRSSFEPAGDGYKLLDSVTGASHLVDPEARKAQSEKKGIILGDNKPQMDLFVMSQCPYGVSTVNAMKPVLGLLGDKIEFNLEFIASANPDGSFASLHGVTEVEEDIRQLCAKDVAPDMYFDYILCQNKDYRNVKINWESCAAEAGINVDQLRSCSEGGNGKDLLRKSIDRTDIFEARGSPAIFIDGETYNGGRTPEEFKIRLCAAFDETPAECDTKLPGAAVQPAPTGNC